MNGLHDVRGADDPRLRLLRNIESQDNLDQAVFGIYQNLRHYSPEQAESFLSNAGASDQMREQLRQMFPGG